MMVWQDLLGLVRTLANERRDKARMLLESTVLDTGSSRRMPGRNSLISFNGRADVGPFTLWAIECDGLRKDVWPFELVRTC